MARWRTDSRSLGKRNKCTSRRTSVNSQLTSYKLPGCSNGISRDSFIRSQEHHPMSDCLANQDAIERILMDVRQTRQMKCGLFINRKDFRANLGPMSGNKLLWTLRQGESTNRVFDRNLPA